MMNKRKILILSLLVLIIIVSSYLRLSPQLMFAAKEIADTKIDNQISLMIGETIESEYPNLNTNQKLAQYQTLYKEYIKENKENITQQKKELTQNISDAYRDENGQGFFLNSDSYLHYRYAQNYIEKGHIWDIEKNGTFLDTHGYYPESRPIGDNFFPKLISLNHKMCTIFNKNASLMQTSYYLPIIFSIICIIFAFLIGKKLKGDLCGILVASVVAFQPMLLERLIAGWVDTDGINYMFTMIITFFYISLKKTNRSKNKLLFGLGLIISILLFKYSWSGYWYLLLLIIASELTALILDTIDKNFEINKQKIALITTLMIIVIISINPIIKNVSTLTYYLGLQETKTNNAIPAAKLTITELRSVGFPELINMLGGPAYLIMTLGGLIYIVYLMQQRKLDTGISVYLIAWYGIMLFASLLGYRFIPYLAIPFSIILGITLYAIIDMISKKYENIMDRKTWTILLTTILLILTIAGWSNQIIQKTKRIPTVNSGFNEIMDNIQDKNAVINTWWDYGSIIPALSGNKVQFDGTTQDGPKLYWMARFFMEKDEEKAINILKMLNCNGEQAYRTLLKRDDSYGSTISLQKIMDMSQEDATKYIKTTQLKEDEQEMLLSCLYCNEPAKTYILVTEDLIQKSNTLSFYGNWNFTKDKIQNIIKENDYQQGLSIPALMQGLDITSDTAKIYYEEAYKASQTDLYSWITLIPEEILGTSFYCNPVQDDKIRCFSPQDGGIYVELNTLETYKEQGSKRLFPKSITYKNQNEIQKKTFDDPDFSNSIFLTKTESGYTMQIIPNWLHDTIIYKLYFEEGEELDHISLISSDIDEEYDNTLLFEVNY